MNFLSEPAIVAAMKQAWFDSRAENPADRHEEGGYILLDSDQSYAIERWPRGTQSRISPSPMDTNGCYNAKVVVAAFHTPPNPPVDEIGEDGSKVRANLTDAGTNVTIFADL